VHDLEEAKRAAYSQHFDDGDDAMTFLGKWPATDRFDLRVGPAAAEAVRAGRLRLRVGKETLALSEDDGP
jgi:hypothetical protein